MREGTVLEWREGFPRLHLAVRALAAGVWEQKTGLFPARLDPCGWREEERERS